MDDTITKTDFESGWNHFCDCIDWGASELDAEAIQFMNEMPGKVLALIAKAKGE